MKEHPILFSGSMVRAILDGRQPRHLNLHAVRGRENEVPLDWEEQRDQFEFASPASLDPSSNVRYSSHHADGH